jgi:hypothetical protein
MNLTLAITGRRNKRSFALSVLCHGPVTSKEERMTNFGPGDLTKKM